MAAIQNVRNLITVSGQLAKQSKLEVSDHLLADQTSELTFNVL
jgi:hypothetical protein